MVGNRGPKNRRKRATMARPRARMQSLRKLKMPRLSVRRLPRLKVRRLPRFRVQQLPRRRIFSTRLRFGWRWIWRLPLLWMACLALCIGLYAFFIDSPTFKVRAVAAAHLAAGDVENITNLCQCVGQNIFTVQPSDIKLRLDEIPTLLITRVYTRLPNQVIVDGGYRVKVAIWRTPEAAYAVDNTGEVLQVWKLPFPKTGWPLPVFDEGYDTTFHKGRRLLVGDSIPQAPLTMARQVRSRLPQALLPQVKTFFYRPGAGLILVGKTGWLALLGMDYSSQLNARLSTLQTILSGKHALLQGQDCVDLRGQYPYYRHDHRCGM